MRVGQEVAVKLEAFPFTRYGTVPGTIESIGSDAQEEQAGPGLAATLTYPVRIRLARATINRDGETVALAPGMAATADIRTGRRSIMSYLVSPIDEARLSAGRER